MPRSSTGWDQRTDMREKHLADLRHMRCDTLDGAADADREALRRERQRQRRGDDGCRGVDGVAHEGIADAAARLDLLHQRFERQLAAIAKVARDGAAIDALDKPVLLDAEEGVADARFDQRP